MTAVPLPAAVNSITVSGSITNAQLSGLLAPVTSVAGSVRVTYAHNIRVLSAPNLVSIGGGLTIASCSRLRALGFGNLTTVGGALSITNMGYLTGSAISAGFPELQTVGGQVNLYAVSRSGTASTSGSLTFPELTTVGSWSLRTSAVGVVSCPLLHTISGNLYFNSLTNVHALDFPLLATVSGSITVTSVNLLSNLCHFSSLPANLTQTVSLSVPVPTSRSSHGLTTISHRPR